MDIESIKTIPLSSTLSPIIGKHAIADFTDCQVQTESLENIDLIRDYMYAAASCANATVVSEHFHKFEPHGISGLLILAESHIALHLWRDEKFISIDCYTCGDIADPMKAIQYLQGVFNPEHSEIQYLKRGPKL